MATMERKITSQTDRIAHLLSEHLQRSLLLEAQTKESTPAKRKTNNECSERFHDYYRTRLSRFPTTRNLSSRSRLTSTDLRATGPQLALIRGTKGGNHERGEGCKAEGRECGRRLVAFDAVSLEERRSIPGHRRV